MTTRVMAVFEFTEADLAANRAGHLSPAQAARLNHSRGRLKRWLLIIGLLMGVIAAGIAYFVFGVSNLLDSGDMNWAGVVSIIPAVVFGLLIWV